MRANTDLLTPYLRHASAPARFLQDGERIYAIGDVHGRLDCLTALLGMIDADRAARPAADMQEIFLGDYVDRGPDSAGVISTLIARKASHGAACLPGNHEAVFLDAMLGLEPMGRYVQDMGGAATLTSYGLRRDETRHEALAAAVPPEHWDFLRALLLSPPFARRGAFLFAHAGLRPGAPLEAQDPADFLWIRGPFLRNDDWLGALVVHGHTPGRDAVVLDHRICVDTGAYATGRLTCVALENEGYRLLQTDRPAG